GGLSGGDHLGGGGGREDRQANEGAGPPAAWVAPPGPTHPVVPGRRGWRARRGGRGGPVSSRGRRRRRAPGCGRPGRGSRRMTEASMRIAKYHGTGNDFVMLEDLGDRIHLEPALVAALCDRHLGIGADGLIRIAPAEGADFFMD